MENVNNITKIEFDRKPVYNEKHIKTKKKSYNGKMSTNFHNNRIPKEFNVFNYCICLSVILIYSVCQKCKNCYPQVFLEECKYVVKEKKSKFISANMEISSGDSDKEK